jgi:hypothetical protein
VDKRSVKSAEKTIAAGQIVLAATRWDCWDEQRSTFSCFGRSFASMTSPMCDDVDDEDDDGAHTSNISNTICTSTNTNTNRNSGNGDDERYADYFESIRSETGLGKYIPRRVLRVFPTAVCCCSRNCWLNRNACLWTFCFPFLPPFCFFFSQPPEIGIKVAWPHVPPFELSTCLSHEEMAPMFHGTQWAGWNSDMACCRRCGRILDSTTTTTTTATADNIIGIRMWLGSSWHSAWLDCF